MIYCDNAATSFPKPAVVTAALVKHLATEAVNPGRSGFDLQRVVFTGNATAALNIALQGVLRPGDHVVGTVLEHNSVLRPLQHLQQQRGITFHLAPCDKQGYVAPEAIARRINERTRLVVMTHASNVLGTVQDVAAVGEICRQRGLLLLVDAAQTAGVIPVDMAAIGAHLLAFTGHKGLMGPTGTGGLLVAPEVDVRPSFWGGTGVRSAQRTHPEEYPYRLEAGTLGALPLAGLRAGLRWVREQPVEETEARLARHFLAGLRELPHVRVLSLEPGQTAWDARRRVPVFSLLIAGMAPDKAGMFLDAEWDIAVRTGLQCAPLAHQAMGTGQGGTVRVSFGPLNTTAEIDTLLKALTSFSK
ncbi:cysteine desulfurase [bacterium DOLJORAL78_65_58]|nr:MAG: cysteine desulfurase [bacterium DOLJORAL78_65_58]